MNEHEKNSLLSRKQPQIRFSNLDDAQCCNVGRSPGVVEMLMFEERVGVPN